MGYLLTDIPNLQIIEVTVEGLLDVEIRQDIISRSYFKLKQMGYGKLIIDIVNTFSPPDQTMTEALSVASFMKTIGFYELLRVAFIYQKEDAMRVYIESSAQALGLHVRYFADREEAIAWLCS